MFELNCGRILHVSPTVATFLMQWNKKKKEKDLKTYISTQGINPGLLGGGCVCEILQSTLTSMPLGSLSEEEQREKATLPIQRKKNYCWDVP